MSSLRSTSLIPLSLTLLFGHYSSSPSLFLFLSDSYLFLSLSLSLSPSLSLCLSFTLFPIFSPLTSLCPFFTSLPPSYLLLPAASLSPLPSAFLPLLFVSWSLADYLSILLTCSPLCAPLDILNLGCLSFCLSLFVILSISLSITVYFTNYLNVLFFIPLSLTYPSYLSFSIVLH